MFDDTRKTSDEEFDARSKIGRRVVYFALAAVTLLGLAGIASSAFADKERVAGVKDIISMILPVLAAWVGTVLAFYFSRENFVAAAESNATVLGLRFDERLQSISVTDSMISIERAATLKTDGQESEIKLKKDLIEGLFNKTGRNRVPILSNEGRARFVLHRSIVDKFIAESVLANSNSPPDTLTLKNIVDSGTYKPWITEYGSVGKHANLRDVKVLMDRNPHCADVFVTADGTREGRVIGWITNVDLLEKLKA